MNAQNDELTREQALLWLSGRRDQDVEVVVTVECGDYRAHVIDAVGRLTHWTDVSPEVLHLDPERRREDIAALYQIGDAVALDLSDADIPCTFRRRQVDVPARQHSVFGDAPEIRADWLVITLAENVEIEVHHKQGGSAR